MPDDSRLPERRWVSERAGISESVDESVPDRPAEPKTGTVLPVRRTRISHLARDSRMPAWRRRLLIAAAAGIAFTIVTNWRVGLTVAVLAGIADAVIRSRSAAASSAEGLSTGAQRKTKRELAKLERSGYRALHMRAIPGTDEVIDHLLIGPTGVYAIDSEQWDKRLPVRTKNARQLWHGPFSQRDRLEHARWEAAEASRFIGDALGEPVSVRPAMAVYGPAIPWGVATIRDVDVFGGDRLRKYLRKHSAGARAPRLSASEVERIYTAADRVLKPKR
jgi:Nuclease-related domain